MLIEEGLYDREFVTRWCHGFGALRERAAEYPPAVAAKLTGVPAEQIVAAAIQEDVDAIGLSILSGAHMTLFARVIELLKERDAEDIKVFGGGIIPEADIAPLKSLGVAAIFTPGTPTGDVVDWVNANVASAA